MFFGQTVPPKQKSKNVKISTGKKNLPHKLKQTAKRAHASAVESPFDDDATRPWQWDARELNAEQLDATHRPLH